MNVILKYLSGSIGNMIKKVLIGVGCSHTQGTEFMVTPPIPDENGLYELGSQKLKDKYGKDRVTSEFITNLTWVGKLKLLMNYDECLNFGIGGRGIDAGIRNLKYYFFKQRDMSNHTIVFMLPSLERLEVLYRSGNDLEDFFGNYILTGNIFSRGFALGDTRESLRKIYIRDFHHQDFINYNILCELFYLQNFLINAGAKFYICNILCAQSLREYPYNIQYERLIDQEEKWVKFMTPLYGFNNESRKAPIPKDLIDNLNWLILDDETHLVRLKDEGLKDDDHLSETGNENLAMAIYEKI